MTTLAEMVFISVLVQRLSTFQHVVYTGLTVPEVALRHPYTPLWGFITLTADTRTAIGGRNAAAHTVSCATAKDICA